MDRRRPSGCASRLRRGIGLVALLPTPGVRRCHCRSITQTAADQLSASAWSQPVIPAATRPALATMTSAKPAPSTTRQGTRRRRSTPRRRGACRLRRRVRDFSRGLGWDLILWLATRVQGSRTSGALRLVRNNPPRPVRFRSRRVEDVPEAGPALTWVAERSTLAGRRDGLVRPPISTWGGHG